jgi:hypothetical protein
MRKQPELTAQELEAACRALVRVDTSSLGLEVQLPVLYPSGDCATVVVAPLENRFIVHDAGFATMALANYGVRLTSKMKARIADLSRHYGCEFSDDRMTRVVPADQLAIAVAVVANASRTIADQLLHVPTQPIVSFKQTVIERVRAYVGTARVRENEPVIGKSGTEYFVGAAVLDNELARPVAYVEAVRDMDGVNKRFREFYDISLVPDLRDMTRIVLYDDAANLRHGDLLVLQEVSNVVRFSDAEARFVPFTKQNAR